MTELLRVRPKMVQTYSLLVFSTTNKAHQMHMIWAYIRHFCLALLVLFVLRDAFSTCTVTVACSAACTLSDKGEFVRSTDCCHDLQMSRCPSKRPTNGRENAFLLPHLVVRPQISAHVSPARSSMNGTF